MSRVLKGGFGEASLPLSDSLRALLPDAERAQLEPESAVVEALGIAT